MLTSALSVLPSKRPNRLPIRGSTFSSHLFYDFQAAGDFTLAEVDPNFSVQTRQVSGAPTWPNATVNKAVAARFGKTRVALCLAPPGSNQPAYVHVDGKLTTVDDGKTLELPGGVGIARENNVYQFTRRW